MGFAIATGGAALIEDIKEYNRSKQSKYAFVAGWDALCLASVVAPTQINAFTNT